ncbi:MAG: hypothetical protein A2V77_01110 [Anaeromyxobacter sp. RBG_16_69_14]|nr:MAG: hypothetical protein A2V77_01110 [Anaeromyxobacter sp. RBG_16_69_14]
MAEFVPGSAPIEVTRAATIERPAGEPAAVAKALKALLAEGGFTAKRALVAYSGPLIEHRLFGIPPVSGETRNELLRGKIAQEVSTPIGELCVSGEIVGKISEQGHERAEALAVFTPEFEIRRLTFLLVEAGISPARIASVPLALAALHPKGDESALVGFVHAEPGRCTITVSSGGKLRFAREFTLQPQRPAESEGGAALPDAVPDYGNVELPGARMAVPVAAAAVVPAAEEAAERLLTDLTRSLLYFRQVSRGGSISKLYWSGEAPSAEAKALILQRLKLEIALHPAEEAASWPTGQAGSPSDYAVPVGLAKAGQIPEQVNLLPEGYQRRRKRRRYVAASVAVWVAFLAVIGAVFAGLHNAETRYREVIEQSEDLASRRAGAQADFLRWVEIRKRAEAVEGMDRSHRSPFTRWRPLLHWLGASVPRDMTFTTITIEGTGAGYRGELRGRVRGKDPSEVQARLNGFLAAVLARSLGEGVLYAPIEVRPMAEDEGRGVIQEFRLTFALAREA